jgi:3-deoxy-7-phosphoheptulonate synthase
MVIVMQSKCLEQDVEKMINKAQKMGLRVKHTEGKHQSILGLIGDTHLFETSVFEKEQGVEKVFRVQKPFKLASRDFHPEDTIIKVKDAIIGDGNFAVMAGPCAVESEVQIVDTAKKVKESGALFLRGGAFKPRTSPYSFQGHGENGLKYLKKASEITNLPIVTEIMDTEDYDLVAEYADIIQIGARNMQNFSLLKKVGKGNKPVLLKRGLSATIEEWLMSAEYIMSEGNSEVILCERGIRTFEKALRNTLDLSVVPYVKQLTHLPILIDPSHATGRWELVPSVAQAAVAIGADGLMIEVHLDPENALSDGAQSLKPKVFDALMKRVNKQHEFNKSLGEII